MDCKVLIITLTILTNLWALVEWEAPVFSLLWFLGDFARPFPLYLLKFSLMSLKYWNVANSFLSQSDNFSLQMSCPFLFFGSVYVFAEVWVFLPIDTPLFPENNWRYQHPVRLFLYSLDIMKCQRNVSRSAHGWSTNQMWVSVFPNYK